MTLSGWTIPSAGLCDLYQVKCLHSVELDEQTSFLSKRNVNDCRASKVRFQLSSLVTIVFKGFKVPPCIKGPQAASNFP
jgi:hypothetical protein